MNINEFRPLSDEELKLLNTLSRDAEKLKDQKIIIAGIDDDEEMPSSKWHPWSGMFKISNITFVPELRKVMIKGGKKCIILCYEDMQSLLDDGYGVTTMAMYLDGPNEFEDGYCVIEVAYSAKRKKELEKNNK